MLVPGVKRSRALQAFIAASWTRSSAKSGRPERPRAKARKWGSVSSNSRLKSSSSKVPVGPSLMAAPVQLLEQVVEAVGQGLLEHRIVELPQTVRPTRLIALAAARRAAAFRIGLQWSL